jgi:DNA-binding transcriptional MerR regulator
LQGGPAALSRGWKNLGVPAGGKMSSETKGTEKLYYRIGEVSAITGVPSYVLRFWEGEFPSIRPQRTDAGQRLYRPADVERIRKIKDLLHRQKFTIQGARQYLRRSEARPGKNLQVELEAVRRELQAIKKLLA